MYTQLDRPKPAEVTSPGLLGRLGGVMVDRRRWVFGTWLLVLVVLGSFAPSVFTSLAGAGWQANGSESVQVRELAQEHFGGNSSAAVQVVVHADNTTIDDPAVQQTLTEATAIFSADDRFGEIIPPQPGMTISPRSRLIPSMIAARAMPVAAGTAPEAKGRRDLRGWMRSAGRSSRSLMI